MFAYFFSNNKIIMGRVKHFHRFPVEIVLMALACNFAIGKKSIQMSKF